MALWNIVHGACVPHEEATQGPKPCVDVDLAKGEDGGEALLKDLIGVAQQLAIPTKRLTGIEDPFCSTRRRRTISPTPGKNGPRWKRG